MKEEFKYPRLNVNLNKVYENVSIVVGLCRGYGINVTGVIKGFNGLSEVVNEYIKGGCARIGTSRLTQIIQLKKENINSTFFLLRSPMMSEVKEVVKYADISLNSELEIIKAIDNECSFQNKKHKIVLMVDVGDLRDGYWDKKEVIDVACYIENELLNIELCGVATNVGCYGSIMPTTENMTELCSIAEKIEEKINRRLEIISGGATTTLSLLSNNEIPERINDIRIGEGIIIARDLRCNWGVNLNLQSDVFTVEAEIIEIKDKPSHPVGKIFSIDPFGNKRVYHDRGIRKRAILAIGKLDFSNEESLYPIEGGIEIIGASSDHLILDVEDYNKVLRVGDIVEFELDYETLMHLTKSSSIKIFKYFNTVIK